MSSDSSRMATEELERLFPAARRCQICLSAGRRPDPKDVRARDEFFDLLRTLLWRFAHRHLKGPDERRREDFVEELSRIVLAALPRLECGPGRPPFAAWLWGVARKGSAKLRRLPRRSTRNLADRDDEIESSTEALDGPLLRQETVDRVRRGLAKLHGEVSEQDYQVLVLLEMEGLSVQEVGKRLNMTRERIYDRHRRMKDRLRAILKLSE